MRSQHIRIAHRHGCALGLSKRAARSHDKWVTGYDVFAGMRPERCQYVSARYTHHRHRRRGFPRARAVRPRSRRLTAPDRRADNPGYRQLTFSSTMSKATGHGIHDAISSSGPTLPDLGRR
jgi:hypothetical protein